MSFENKIIFLTSVSVFISVVDVNIVMVSYPVLAQVFGVNLSGIVIVSISFLMALAIGLPISGSINDLIGVKKTFFIGYAILIITSIFCAISDSLNQLALLRGLQGFGAALLSIASTSVIIIFIQPQRRGRAFGVLAISGALGLTLGAPIGGILTGYIGWQSIFLFIVPPSLFIVVYSYYVLPSHEDVLGLKEFIKRFDFIGALLVSTGISAFVYAMDSFITTNTYAISNITALLFGIIVIIIFIRFEMNTKLPLMDFSILKNRYFSIILLANMSAIMLLSINNFIVPFFLMQELNLTPQHTGFVMIAFSVVFGLLSPFIGKLSEKFSPYWLCFIGMSLALFFTIYFLFNLQNASVTQVVILLIGYGIAFAFFITPAHSTALSLATKKNAGSTTALFHTTRQIASLLAIVLVGLLAGNTSTNITLGHFKDIFSAEIVMSLLSIFFIIYLLLLKKRESS